jgi:hypothetical protein
MPTASSNLYDILHPPPESALVKVAVGIIRPILLILLIKPSAGHLSVAKGNRRKTCSWILGSSPRMTAKAFGGVGRFVTD